jgi:hypothetical protein
MQSKTWPLGNAAQRTLQAAGQELSNNGVSQ